MSRSDFWAALDQVFGSAYGRSLCADLVLADFGATAQQALERGIQPQLVWQALLHESGRDKEEYLFWHRGKDFDPTRH